MNLPLRLLLTMLLLAGAAFTVSLAQEAQDGSPVAGTWEGAIEVPGFPLEVTVVLDEASGEWTGSIDIPAQGAQGIPLENIEVEGDSASFMMSATPGEPTFEGSAAEGEMTGTFSQAGQQFPFSLARTGEAGEVETAVPQEEYTDPEGRYSFPVPAGWSVTEEEGYVTVSGPEGLLQLHIVVLEEEDLRSAVEEAWNRVDEDLQLTEVESLEPP